MAVRNVAALMVVAAMGVLALGVGSASATTALRLDPGNTAFSGALSFTNTTSGPSELSTNVGSIACTATKGTFDLAASSSATSITGLLTSLTLTSCVESIPQINITGCHLHQPTTAPTVHITSGAGGGTAVVGNVVMRCAIQGSTSGCYYSAMTASGTADNTASSLTFPSVTVATVQPTTDALVAGLCGVASTFRGQGTHMVQSTTNKTLTLATS